MRLAPSALAMHQLICKFLSFCTSPAPNGCIARKFGARPWPFPLPRSKNAPSYKWHSNCIFSGVTHFTNTSTYAKVIILESRPYADTAFRLLLFRSQLHGLGRPRRAGGTDRSRHRADTGAKGIDGGHAVAGRCIAAHRDR